MFWIHNGEVEIKPDTRSAQKLNKRSGFLTVSRKQRIEEVAVNARLNGREQRFGSCPVACFPYATVEAALKPVVADSPAPGTSAGGQPGGGSDHEFGVGFNLKIKHPQLQCHDLGLIKAMSPSPRH